MIYLLFAIAGIMSIITAAIINGMDTSQKYGTLKKFIVILISILIYIAVAIFLLKQKGHY